MTSPVKPLLDKKRAAPPALLRAKPMWARLAAGLEGPYAKLLGAPVDAGKLDISAWPSTMYLSTYRLPGVLVPMRLDDQPGSFIRCGAATARRLAACLLRSCDVSEADGPAELLDGLLLSTLASPIVGALSSIFGVVASQNEFDDPTTDWPVETMRNSSYWLVVSLSLKLDDYAFGLDLILPGDHPAFADESAADTPSQDHAAAALLQAPITLNALIGRWEMRSSAVSTLRPGSTLKLADNVMDRVRLSVQGPQGEIPIALGEHGRHDGRQAIRVTEASLAS